MDKDHILYNAETQKAIDEESVKGCFGWEIIGEKCIPYIHRLGQKYCAVRMVEMEVLNRYLKCLHQDIYNCAYVNSYYITQAERCLLNKINIEHCDSHFGRKQFTSRDRIVLLTDAIQFHEFLHTCYTKMINGESCLLRRSGFIRINKESLVPFVVCDNEKYVPLFYFEGELSKLKTYNVEGWDFFYLKFCCKIQGIKKEFFLYNFCSVVRLNELKNYLPPNTLLENYWPKESLYSHLLICKNSRNQLKSFQWTQTPTATPMLYPHSIPKAVTELKSDNANSQMDAVRAYDKTRHHPYSEQPSTSQQNNPSNSCRK